MFMFPFSPKKNFHLTHVLIDPTKLFPIMVHFENTFQVPWKTKYLSLNQES